MITEIQCDSCKKEIDDYLLGGVLWHYDYNLNVWSKPCIVHNQCINYLLNPYTTNEIKFISLEYAIEPKCFIQFIKYLDWQSIKILIEKISFPIASQEPYFDLN